MHYTILVPAGSRYMGGGLSPNPGAGGWGNGARVLAAAMKWFADASFQRNMEAAIRSPKILREVEQLLENPRVNGVLLELQWYLADKRNEIGYRFKRFRSIRVVKAGQNGERMAAAELSRPQLREGRANMTNNSSYVWISKEKSLMSNPL